MQNQDVSATADSSQEARYYLRVEAVNLSNTVYDTNDISTIRGGGFLVLNAVNALTKFPFLEHISTGASSGLFKILNGTNPDAACSEALKALDEATGGHATFVADIVDSVKPDGSKMSFTEIQETLMAKNRWRQFQQLTVPWGGGWAGASGEFESCELNGIHPAVHIVDKDPDKQEDKGKKIAECTFFKREQGRDLRQRIYAKILKVPETTLPSFTRDLKELSTFEEHHPDFAEIKKNLDGKIAFIYIDGNKFTKIRGDYVAEAGDLTEFDRVVQDKFRAKVLAKVIEHMSVDPGSQAADGRLRLETLLWGGDELEWVVPAWKGWDILQIFYEQKPVLDAKKEGEKSWQLTHGAGIVFCHHTAPILEIRKMARSLAEMAKDKLEKDKLPSHETGDIFHYLVLESLDRTEADLGIFLESYYRPAPFGDLMMHARDMKDFTESMERLKTHFPRNKIFTIMDILRLPGDGKKKPDDPSKGERIEKIVDRALTGCPERENCILAIKGILGGEIKDTIKRWFIIADLWDFVGGAQ